MKRQYLYAGSWLDESGRAGGGIRIYEVGEKGELTLTAHLAEELAAGYLTLSADKQYLYAVNELKRRPDEIRTEGSVYAYAVNPKNGSLKELNCVSSCGVFPNYLALAPDGKQLFVVNYGSEDMVVRSTRNERGEFILEAVSEESSMAALDILEDGTLSPVKALHVCLGEPSRYFEWFQSAPHPHCIGLDPSGSMLLVADRGCDKILTCLYDREKKEFHTIHEYKTTRGIGPRNCVFHPTLPFVYVVGEVKPYVTVYQYDAQEAALTELGTYLTAPKELEYRQEGEFFAFSHPSDIKIHPDGKTLYVANRGPDTIRCFRIEEGGTLTHLTDVSAEGGWPWSLDVTSDGRHMYVGNKMSSCISAFDVDEEGIPGYTGHSYEAERTVCLKCARF